MLSLQFPITVYLLRTWLDSTRHIIFNNWSHTLKTATGQKVEKKNWSVRPKMATRWELKPEWQLQSFFVLQANVISTYRPVS